MTPRKASVLALQLPAGSRVWTELGYDNAWTNGEHFLADLVDASRGANWQRAGSPGKVPDPISRPSQQKADNDRETSREEVRVNRARNFRERMRARQATN